jgi:ubiquinone/menaquinone biosynthesis C-methylase UbiE
MTEHSVEYEYHGLMAETWDLFRGDTSQWEDRFFFLECIQKFGQPVLDVGCGTGRLTLDYLGQGIDIDGVDNSPEMLAICRQKAQAQGLTPRLYEQWMETLALPRQYRTILVPSSSFQLLLDEEKAQRAMGRFYAHLLPGGTLVMPFMLLWQPGDPVESNDWELAAEKTRPSDGVAFRKWSRARYDLEAQLEHTEDRYQKLVNGHVVLEEYHLRTPATRWYTQVQAAELYRKAGFRQVDVLHGFSLEPVMKEDTLFTVVGGK